MPTPPHERLLQQLQRAGPVKYWPIVVMRTDLRVFTHGRDLERLVFEGAPDMSDPRAEKFAKMVKSGTVRKNSPAAQPPRQPRDARITVSRSLSNKRFGKGGEVMVSVTAPCPWDKDTAAGMIKELGSFIDEQFDEQVDGLNKLLQKHGIMDPEGMIYE
jgi:hypothetical protein